MKIAFTAKGKDLQAEVDARFGRCPFFVIYDTETKLTEVIDNQDSSQEAHGAGPKTAQKLAEYKCQVLITGNGPGGNASSVVERMKIEIFIGAADMKIENALQAYQNGDLKNF
ncbi:MAG: NifB/NifX family molybdenum-iron cluster-binding protein [Bacteroidales bacterium]|nr:NifB/NifX family molybdenum-iron cluster-binding protein [Bacteroidales bacterium]